MLFDGPESADRLITAVPLHNDTKRIAHHIAGRCRDAGIEIALVSGAGDVQLIAEAASD